MTCKISFFKSLRETLRHHIASLFMICIVFFVQLVVFFLNLQTYTSRTYIDYDPTIIVDNFREFTLPSFIYTVPIIISAIILAYDLFRYLHSRKQVDFYDSLPVKRKDWFILRSATAFVIFFIPYVICTLLEMIMFFVMCNRSGIIMTMLEQANVRLNVFLANLGWNFICMLLIYFVTFFTGALAMIMTGHSIIAFCGFGLFAGYFPVILGQLYPCYAARYFSTYCSNDLDMSLFYCLSPFGLTYRLLFSCYSDWTAKAHAKDFLVIVLMTLLVAFLSYVLFEKRPSESAGRAMAFEKANPVIRSMIVIPLALYLGLYLSEIAYKGELIWMLFGFVIGVVLLHGIIECIYQFDIRGLGSHKLQMFGCLIGTLGIASIFWFDLFGFDDYLPKYDQLEFISFETAGIYNTRDDFDGVSGEYLDEAYELAKNIVDNRESDHENVEWITFTYALKNGKQIHREYRYELDNNIKLLDKIYATEDFKEDICNIYFTEPADIEYIEWGDFAADYPLYLTENELELLFETYMAEFTTFKYSTSQEQTVLGQIYIPIEVDNYIDSYYCDIYPEFTQTISLLEDLMKYQEATADYGKLTTPLLARYDIKQLEFYLDDGYITIIDTDQIALFKDMLIQTDEYHRKYGDLDYDDVYDVGVSIITKNGIQYVSSLINRVDADRILNELGLLQKSL